MLVLGSYINVGTFNAAEILAGSLFRIKQN